MGETLVNQRRYCLIALFCVLFTLPVVGADGLFTDVHRIDVLDLFISEKYLSCTTTLVAVVEIRNSGQESESAHVELSSQDLGVREFSPLVLLAPRQIQSLSLPFTLREEPKGSKEFEVIVYFGNEVKRSFKSFTFLGCPEEVPLVSSPLTPPSSSLPPTASSLTLSSVSAHLLFSLVLGLLLFFLAVIYLLKLYIRKNT